MKKLTKEQEQERNNFELKVSSIISATNLSGNDKLKKIMILYDELTALSGVGEEEKVKTEWVCNECNMLNFTGSVSQEDIDAEKLSCINCGCFEFHKSNPKNRE